MSFGTGKRGMLMAVQGHAPFLELQAGLVWSSAAVQVPAFTVRGMPSPRRVSQRWGSRGIRRAIATL